MKLRTWLRPGMLVKRWILMLLSGLVLTSLAMAMTLAWIYRNFAFPTSTARLIQDATLQFIPHPYRELLVVATGAMFILAGFLQLSRSLLSPFLSNRTNGQALAEILAEHRFGADAPELRIVVIGGGTGLSTVLRGLKKHNVSITAVVTVGDDGGSSGRLRNEFHVPPPGDIRNCLVALADSEPLMSELFQYRFDSEDSALHGHSLGNLFITALTKVSGSFERAVIESSRVLNIRGTVLPSTLEDITLGAEMADGSVVRGESLIPDAHGQIARAFITPAHAQAYDPAIVAILSADLIVLGPGSLYTSVIPNLLIEGIAHALRFAPGERVYVCNVATQPGETDDYAVIDHLRALNRHVHGLPIDRVLVNSNLAPSLAKIRPEWHVSAVRNTGLFEFLDQIALERRDVVNVDSPLRHDPDKLAESLIDLARQAVSGVYSRGAPLATASRTAAGQEPAYGESMSTRSAISTRSA